MNLEGKLDSGDTQLMLTHGELAPHNIMVDKTSGNILAIFDWEMFGWYPAFWE
jgi:aminoglycoside phosphotransferase (APT) family kinase protein